MENPSQNYGASQNPSAAPQGGTPPQGYGPQPQQPIQAYGPQPQPGPQAYGPQPQQPYGYGPQPQQPYGAPAPQGGKSSVAAGLLGIFLGWTGAHCFYLGYKQLAFIHLGLGGGGFVLTIISFILPFIFAGSGNITGAAWSVLVLPAIAGIGYLLMAGSGIWGLIEGIMCFSKSGKFGRDADGVPLV